jgi:hypothetical protein
LVSPGGVDTAFVEASAFLAPAPVRETVSVSVEELDAIIDGSGPGVVSWLTDLPRAVVPELVIRVPLEGVPQYSLEDGEGCRLAVRDPRRRQLADWLSAARHCGALMVNAASVAEAFALLDEERLGGGQPGRLFKPGGGS